MDFRLRVFIEVSQHLSFTKAARGLGVSQPAITKHIQELESIYRVQLFERSAGKIALTPQGNLFLEHAERIVAAYRNLQDDMELVAHKLEGELRLGSNRVVAKTLLLPMASDFMEKFPELTISLMAGDASQIEHALDENKIDIAIALTDRMELLFAFSKGSSKDKTDIFASFAKRWYSQNSK